MDDYKSWLHDPSERVECVVRSGTQSKWRAALGVVGSELVMTDKRLYQRGTYIVRVGGDVKSSEGSNIVAVKDITGVGREEVRFGEAVGFGMLLAAIGAAVLGYSVSRSGGFSCCCGTIGTWPIGLLLLLGGVALMLGSQRTLFTVGYPGGSIAVDVDWFAREDLDRFERTLSRLRDASTVPRS